LLDNSKSDKLDIFDLNPEKSILSLKSRHKWLTSPPIKGWFSRSCKYQPAEPVALRLLAPQSGLFATVRSNSKNKSKTLVLLLSSLPQHRQFEREYTPEILKVLLPPRQSRGICSRFSHHGISGSNALVG